MGGKGCTQKVHKNQTDYSVLNNQKHRPRGQEETHSKLFYTSFLPCYKSRFKA